MKKFLCTLTFTRRIRRGRVVGLTFRLVGLTLTLTLSFSFITHAQLGEWTWMSGSNTVNGAAVYGTQGTPSVLNHPSGLYEACEWTDTSGMFWLYGGSSYSMDLANLWKYNPATNEWTWVKGPGNSGSLPVYGTQGIPAPGNTPGNRAYGVTTFTGKDGHLWLFGGYGGGPNNDLWRYNISTNEWTWVKGPNVASDPGSYGTQGVPSPSNLPPCRAECAASWVDTSGNLWFFGGALYADSYNDLWKYDPVTNEWTWMKGSTVINVSGDYGTKGVSSATNTPGARNSYTKWYDGNNNLYLFGGDAFAFGQQYNDVWKYSTAINEWVWISGTNLPNNSGNASVQCSPDTNNYPSGRRESRACWVDQCGKFWFYGGSSQSSFYGSHSDLWKFDPVTLQWTWASGPLGVLQPGDFGTQGVSSPTNQPPARSGNLAWTDNDGNLWMFGGCDQSWPNAWNDLWRYMPDSLCSGSCITNNPQQINFASSDTDICEKFCIDFFDSSLNAVSWEWLFPGGNPSSSTDQNPTNICYDDPGMFDVTLITVNSSGDSDTLTLPGYITVYTNPFAPTITQTGNVLTSSPADSYQWYLNTVIIPGATSQSITITQSGLYTVEIADSNGCVAQASIDAGYVGIDLPDSESAISIYPNPSNGNFIIEWMNAGMPSEQMANEISVEVINTLGQTVFTYQGKISSPNWNKEIDLSDEPPAIYFLQLRTDHNFLQQKIIVSR